MLEVVTATLMGSIASYLTFKKVRPLFPVKVNCWFCSRDLNVPYNERNGFLCPECDQYNGFSEDGDYNWQDPDKYRLPRESSSPPSTSGTETKLGNALCNRCTLNQNLKVHQLAKFVPRREEDFDAEVEEFEAHLEKTYRLCRTCEANLLQTLGEQDAWIKPQLLSWKLDLNRQTLKRSADIIRRNLVHPEKPALSILVFFFAILISQFGNHHPGNKEVIEVSNATDKGLVGQVEASSTFPFWRPCVLLGLGIVVVSNVKFSNPAQVRHPINVGLIVTWILLTCLTLGLTFDLNLPFVEIILPYLAYACVTFSALTLVGDVYNWQKLAKKIETKETQMPYRPQLSSGFVSADEKDETMTQELLTNSSRESSSLKQTSILRPPSLNLASSRPCSPFIPIREKEDAESLLESQEIHLGATQRDISALSLDGSEDEREDGSPKPTAHAQREGTVSAFSIRDYDVSSGALQRSGIDFGNGKSPLIRPSRFGSAAHSQSNAPKSRVTKTSWVAGGYWQSGKNRGFASNSKSRANLATNGGMSRSSSHSSGFGSLSQGMNQGLFLSNSPPNSILGEERQSLFSEPLFHNLSRPPSQQGSILSRPPSVISQRRETHSQAGSETSCDSDFDRMTQEAFDSLKPKAKSSPIPKNEVKQSAGFLERQIDLKCSVYSILLGLSIAFNVAVLGGVVIYNL